MVTCTTASEGHLDVTVQENILLTHVGMSVDKQLLRVDGTTLRKSYHFSV